MKAKPAKVTRLITLGSGRRVTLGTYVAAWKKLKTMDPKTQVDGWQWYPVNAGWILDDMRAAMMDRINQGIPAMQRGMEQAA
jgi:hypothetical protein